MAVVLVAAAAVVAGGGSVFFLFAEMFVAVFRFSAIFGFDGEPRSVFKRKAAAIGAHGESNQSFGAFSGLCCASC